MLLFVGTVACAESKPPPKSIDALRGAVYESRLAYEKAVTGGPGFSAYLVSYASAGLNVFALVAVPEGPRPAKGYPVLIANHGHHPDPPNYGVTKDGIVHRPGDYYRDVPALYAAHGFLVVMPDYRGHNASEGSAFTEGLLEAAYYAEDVLALLSAIDDIEQADADNIFMWGHSMGGEVTLRTLLATRRVKAASLWSSVGGDIWDQAYFYSRTDAPLATDSHEVEKPAIEALREQMATVDANYDWLAREPLVYLDMLSTPLIIHHAIGDRGAAYKWSERLAKELTLLDKPYVFYSYDSDEHFFSGADREAAVSRDVRFFRRSIGTPPATSP